MRNTKEKRIGIGVIGLGTVGCGLIKLIQQNSDLIKTRTGITIDIIAVGAKHQNKERCVDLSSFKWLSNPVDVLKFEEIDCVVELVGGHQGLAKDLVFQSVKAGKHVVTANKALIAVHGHELARLAAERKVNVYFDAAVAGGIPIVRTMLNSLSSDETYQITGIINGTCNYILTEMEKNLLSYEDVFGNAQNLGYVEANPELDIGGIDSAHKLTILSNIAFSQKVLFDDINITGIKNISLFDITSARELGFRIKLLAVAKITQNGIYNEVSPCLIPLESPIAQVVGSENIILVDSSSIGKTYYRGPGAGEGPTASAVLADIINISADSTRPLFGIPESKMEITRPSGLEFDNSFYVRITIKDQPGALSHVTGIFAHNNVSISRMRQKDHDGQEAPIVLLTHKTSSLNMNNCIKQLSHDNICVEEPIYLRVENI